MKETFKKLLPFASLIVLFVFLCVASPYFLRAGNLSSVVRQTTVITIMAIGMTVVIATAGIDLSVGSIVGMTGVCGVMLIAEHYSTIAALLGAIVVGMACGAFNGAVITFLKIPPFVATLGALGMYRGLTLLMTKGQPVVPPLGADGRPNTAFGVLANGDVLPWIPLPLVFIIVVGLMIHWVLNHTKIGRYAYAIGSNREAARCCGIQIWLYTIIIYALNGALTGMAGMIDAARLVTGQPTAGGGYELSVIAAVVIGGGSLSGGQGTVLGTIVGSLIMGLLSNGCNLLRIDPFIQQVIIGAVIVLAVSFDEFQKRRAAE
jgi:ribose transport system permease protein